MSFKDLRANVPAVPTLAEVLALKNLHFMLEVKTALRPDQITILQRQLQIGTHQGLSLAHLAT
jgi:hypothetical protein